MNYTELVGEVMKLLDMYKPKQCVDSFIEDSTHTLMTRSSDEQIFITDTVYGCIVHQKLLDAVINIFYEQKAKHFLKTDRNHFLVVSYLAMFHLDDLGLEQFSTIIKSLDNAKMYKFLSFFFNVTNLTTLIRGKWSQLYDITYVDNKWIAPLLRWQTEMEGLLQYLQKKTTKGGQPKKFPKKSTEPQEFILTKPKHRPVPAPEPIPQMEKPKPVPASTHRAPKEPRVLEEIKQKNHLKAQKILYEANTQQFRCADPQKSAKTKDIISQIHQNNEANLKFDSVYSSGTPATHKTHILPTRVNTTVILRQEALHNRHMEEELNRLEHLMLGSNEPSAFLQWQKEMREKDLQEELAQLENRRMEGKISHEEAVLARQRVLELNQYKGLLKKKETAQLMRRYAEKRLQEEKEMKELVQLVADGHKNCKAAKKKLQEIKKRIVKEVSEQNRELLRQALEEAQAELSRKFELIRQIRDIESVPHPSHKFIDETETGGHRLLCEMSLAELRERLTRLQEATQEELEKKRQSILEEKQREKQRLEKIETVTTAWRNAAALATAKKKEEEKQTKLKVQEAARKDERLVALQKVLEKKEQELHGLREAEKAKSQLKNKKMAAEHIRSYSHKKRALDREYWLQLEQALEKRIQRDAARQHNL